MAIHYFVEEKFLLLLFTRFQHKNVSKCHGKYCFKINDEETIKTAGKAEYDRFKHFDRKIKSQFIIEADFESILVSE